MDPGSHANQHQRMFPEHFGEQMTASFLPTGCLGLVAYAIPICLATDCFSEFCQIYLNVK